MTAKKQYCIIFFISVFVIGCNTTQKELLTLNGRHAFGSLNSYGGVPLKKGEPCILMRAEPSDAVRNPGGKRLVLETLKEGSAEVICGKKKYKFEIVSPANIKIIVIDGTDPNGFIIGEDYVLRPELYDKFRRVLKAGELTTFKWTVSEELEIVRNRSAGEFGYYDTSYGIQRIRAVKPGKGIIEVSLGNLKGHLEVIISGNKSSGK